MRQVNILSTKTLIDMAEHLNEVEGPLLNNDVENALFKAIKANYGEANGGGMLIIKYSRNGVKFDRGAYEHSEALPG